MEQLPLISVIVPIYKVEDYLPLCVDSVLAQTYDNLEIILVNDGSPDGCGKICEEYAKRDERIVVVHKQNGGLSDARNAGLDICKGEYIAFVDSDDLVHARFIEMLYEKLIADDTDLVFCAVSKFTDATDMSSVTNARLDSGDSMVFNKAQIFDELLYHRKFLYEHVVAWNKLYKRAIWDTLRYPKGRIHEDVFVIHHIVDLCSKIVYIDNALYFYRQREGSIQAVQKTEKQIIDMYDAFEDRKIFFKQKQIEHSILNQIQKRLLFDNAIIIGNTKLKDVEVFGKILKDELPISIKVKLIMKRYNPGFFHLVGKLKKTVFSAKKQN